MRQGEIWMAELNPVRGSEQAGYRPVVIISGDLLNTFAPVLICCPLTTSIKSYKGNVILEPTAENGLKHVSEIMVYHVRSLAENRRVERVGHVPETVVKQLHQTMQILLTT